VYFVVGCFGKFKNIGLDRRGFEEGTWSREGSLEELSEGRFPGGKVRRKCSQGNYFKILKSGLFGRGISRALFRGLLSKK
jgi:hypothetical protein